MKPESKLLEFIVCPFCAAPLKQASVLRRDRHDRIEYGVLSCGGCGFEYPIVAGVLILLAPHETVDSKSETTDFTKIAGPRVRDLVWLVKTNQPVMALSLLLNPATLDERWFFSLNFSREPRQVGAPTAPDAENPRRARRLLPLRADRMLRRFAVPRVRRRLARFLMADADKLTAFQAMDLYYRRYSRSEIFNYFAYRFGQPRHLAALSLAALLTEAPGPILDLACGTGHMTHFFSSVRPDQVVIGIDREFFPLWIAQRYVAPNGYFICTSADRALPVCDQAFHGVFCSDAFHCFLHKSTAVREMQRVLTVDGIIALARFGNAVEPREGYELQVEGYARLFPKLTSVLLGEEALIRAYLDRRGPDLHVGVTAPDLAAQKWLSLVVSKNADLFASGRRFTAWPHAFGELRVNPIYRVTPADVPGDLDLQFRFPSEWYQFENQGYLAYAPDHCRVRASVVRALERGDRTPEVEELIAQFVVLGMPHRYC